MKFVKIFSLARSVPKKIYITLIAKPTINSLQGQFSAIARIMPKNIYITLRHFYVTFIKYNKFVKMTLQ